MKQRSWQRHTFARAVLAVVTTAGNRLFESSSARAIGKVLRHYNLELRNTHEKAIRFFSGGAPSPFTLASAQEQVFHETQDKPLPNNTPTIVLQGTVQMPSGPGSYNLEIENNLGFQQTRVNIGSYQVEVWASDGVNIFNEDMINLPDTTLQSAVGTGVSPASYSPSQVVPIAVWVKVIPAGFLDLGQVTFKSVQAPGIGG